MELGRSRFVKAIGAVTCALLLNVPVAVGADATDSDRVDDAVEFRRDLGFPHDRDRVERTFQETDTYDDARYGVLLSAEETEEMVRRARNRTQQRDAVTTLSRSPDSVVSGSTRRMVGLRTTPSHPMSPSTAMPSWVWRRMVPTSMSRGSTTG